MEKEIKIETIPPTASRYTLMCSPIVSAIGQCTVHLYATGVIGDDVLIRIPYFRTSRYLINAASAQRIGHVAMRDFQW